MHRRGALDAGLENRQDQARTRSGRCQIGNATRADVRARWRLVAALVAGRIAHRVHREGRLAESRFVQGRRQQGRRRRQAADFRNADEWRRRRAHHACETRCGRIHLEPGRHAHRVLERRSAGQRKGDQGTQQVVPGHRRPFPAARSACLDACVDRVGQGRRREATDQGRVQSEERSGRTFAARVQPRRQAHRVHAISIAVLGPVVPQRDCIGERRWRRTADVGRCAGRNCVRLRAGQRSLCVPALAQWRPEQRQRGVRQRQRQSQRRHRRAGAQFQRLRMAARWQGPAHVWRTGHGLRDLGAAGRWQGETARSWRCAGFVCVERFDAWRHRLCRRDLHAAGRVVRDGFDARQAAPIDRCECVRGQARSRSQRVDPVADRWRLHRRRRAHLSTRFRQVQKISARAADPRRAGIWLYVAFLATDATTGRAGLRRIPAELPRQHEPGRCLPARDLSRYRRRPGQGRDGGRGSGQETRLRRCEPDRRFRLVLRRLHDDLAHRPLRHLEGGGVRRRADRLGDGLHHLVLPDGRRVLLRRLTVDGEVPRYLARSIAD